MLPRVEAPSSLIETTWVSSNEVSQYHFVLDLDQPCVARKKFGKEFLHKANNDAASKQKNGLDDYQCAYPHFVICSCE